MKFRLLIFFLVLFFAGCKSRNKIPQNILPQAKMQAVLQDMIRADKFLTDFVFIKDTSLNKDTASIKLYEQVFRIHHISKENFQQSFAFYRAHPLLLKVLLDSLNTRRNNAPAQQYNSEPVTDTAHFFKRIVKPPQNTE